MARMIPASFPRSAPPGEKSVYSALARGADTEGWHVLHSLNIADHVRNPEGEADFVVIAPGLGILVIEVKSHSRVDYRDGLWYLGSQEPSARGPFRQATEAKHSIRAYLKKKKVDLWSLPVISAVWFTSVRARSSLPPTPEWHGWEVMDSEDLRTAPIRAIRRTFSAGLTHLRRTFPSYGDTGIRPDVTDVSRIAAVLRPSFEFGVVAGDLRNARRQDLLQFEAEQYVALDAMQDNRSVLFLGPAGSGKTLLAIEAARRETAGGKSGRLLCFNHLLSKRLTEAIRHVPEVQVSTIHSAMLEIVGAGAPSHPTANFWTHELPDRAAEALVDRGEEAQADFLILDEVQDMLTEPYLDVLDLLLKGGLDKGRLLLFGDFERQMIYDAKGGEDRLRARAPHLPINRLTMNCRNLPRIGYAVNIFSGLTPGYQKFRRLDDGVNPTWMRYSRSGGQALRLREAVELLRSENYDLSEIVVLSPLGDGSTAATTDDTWLRQILRPLTDRPTKKGELKFGTVHSFKGLEAPAIIITDLDADATVNFDSLLYVGLTRATDRLVGIMESSTGLTSLGGMQ